MKKIGCCLVVLLTLAASSFAGPVVQSSKEYKAPVEPTPCFGDHEFQADVFGAYAVTEAHQGGIIRDHGWGGGVGLNYFFSRYFGLGVEGYWLDAKPEDERIFSDSVRSTIKARENARNSSGEAVHSATGSIIMRYPIDAWCLAPYLFVGGGGHWDGKAYGSAHWGGGLEYRIIPQKLGIFVDGRFTVLADKKDVEIHNPHFSLVRAGIRWVF